MRANDIFELTSAQSESSYARSVRADGENISAARSNFMVEHKLITGLDYTLSSLEIMILGFLLYTLQNQENPIVLLLMVMKMHFQMTELMVDTMQRIYLPELLIPMLYLQAHPLLML